MWKLFQQEMGTVILKTCGTVRHGKSRRRRFPRGGPGTCPEPTATSGATVGGGQVWRGKPAGPRQQTPNVPLAEPTRGQDGQSPAQGVGTGPERHPKPPVGNRLCSRRVRAPKDSRVPCLSALYPAAPGDVPGTWQKYPKSSRNTLKEMQ